jgi:hypothetical protein
MNAVDEVLAAVDSAALFGDVNDRMKGKLKYRRLLTLPISCALMMRSLV